MTEEEKKEILKTCKKLKKLCNIRLIFNRYIPLITIGILIFIKIIIETYNL